jgi:xanthine/uracil/vitamin C permease (AzgA family)
MFFVSVFFAPIFASIPAWATGGALVIVGSMMIRKYALSPVFLSLYMMTTF